MPTEDPPSSEDDPRRPQEGREPPGLEGVEKATGIDVAGKIVDLLEKRASPGKTRTRGRG